VDGHRPQLQAAGCRIAGFGDEDALCRRAARFMTEGQVLGWFQGRAEFGPRALGNRSIVCDPRRADMKSVLNDKIKKRESFRPFAPSVLAEAAADWFEHADAAPFMSEVLAVQPDKRRLIPAVTHVDGSGRLQTVAADANPRFHRLIEAFRDLSGVPMLLNTSFNENEPIVSTPRQAIECFLRTKMDALVLGDIMIERRSDMNGAAG
ncbi:MAG: carbamoyltransferase, partial [Pseudolabrys sp.]|nr:carbamoyltransferase [Pseudolabrys sp.]